MKSWIKHVTLVALLATVLPAQAAIQAWQFSGQIDSGHYNGTSYQGQFSFDDASLLDTGTELISLSSLQFNFGGDQFGLSTPALSAANAVFQDGLFTGLEWSVDSNNPLIGFTFVAGFADSSDAYLAYDTALGFSGAGSLAYVAVVPEPAQTALMLMGLGLVGVIARRRS
ncbi:PEP-CTERM sorting domain-containing protein [Methylophilus aquaticus]|uniref:PEP-CTERM sorting domain-containing protein n=1 Tax=Methylophilus aquaticus TaxID=1971610 RepID=A0ABT9JUL0_9PROT|nr:PEP-CTERM sorting domain-containing protein [Methylophilus aquaticus]MDP8568206.1 PEP-CTERM sorting domain-containing protein [Methylophilus aquaticus]